MKRTARARLAMLASNGYHACRRAPTDFAQCIDRWWYLPCLAFLAGLDLFIWIVPTDLLVIGTALLRPARWIRIVPIVALGSALGMLAFAYGIGWGGLVMQSLLNDAGLVPYRWTGAREFVEHDGVWTLFVLILSPIVPPQPAIVLAVLTGMKPGMVFSAALCGRLCRYGLYALVAAKAPRLIARWFKPIQSRAPRRSDPSDHAPDSAELEDVTAQ